MWRMLGAFAMLLVATSVSAQPSSSPPLPPPGRLIDVGGWRLHLNCTGTSSPQTPTVILEAGIGDFSVEWSLVQPRVAKFARVCSYDRGGDGWSDWGPHPRTFKQLVYELHTLLDRSGERPPYVMVGQSYGGWLVRQYRSTYPSEVSGIVFVDAGEDNPLRIGPDRKAVPASELAKGAPIPAVKTSGPLRRDELSPRIVEAMSVGMPDAIRYANDPPRDNLPEDAKRMRTWAAGQLGHIAAAVNPVEVEELALLHAELTANAQMLGEMPLIVITRGKPENSPERETAHREAHKVLAAMSRNGKLVVAEKSGHHVHLEEPDVVSTAIQDVVNAAKK